MRMAKHSGSRIKWAIMAIIYGLNVKIVHLACLFRENISK